MTVDPRALPLLSMADGVIDMGKTITELSLMKNDLQARVATQEAEIARLKKLAETGFAPRFPGDVPTGKIRIGIRSDTNTAQAGLVRSFWRPDQVTSSVSYAKANHTAGQLPWLSYKLPGTWAQAAAGNNDAWLKDIFTRLNDLGKPVWVAFHHEPEGDGVIDDWKAMQRRFAAAAKAYPNIAYSIILTGWNQFYGSYPMSMMWPGDDAGINILGFDPYSWWGTVKNGVKNTENPEMFNLYWSKIYEFVKTRPNLAWAVAETALTDEYFATWPGAAWMRNSAATAAAYGAVAWTYWDYGFVGDDPSYSFRLSGAKLAAFNAVANAPHSVKGI